MQLVARRLLGSGSVTDPLPMRSSRYERRKPMTSRILSAMQTEPRIRPIGRMFSVQDKLAKLPVPPMEQTLQKYMRAVRPLVNDDDYMHTERLVEEFKKSPGPQLQGILEKRAMEKTNWLSDWWKDVAYLSIRDPVLINSNPCVIFPKQEYTDKKGQLRFAAKLIAGAIDYKLMIDDALRVCKSKLEVDVARCVIKVSYSAVALFFGTYGGRGAKITLETGPDGPDSKAIFTLRSSQSLPVELLGGKPLCMVQYYTILGGCRVPGTKRDTHVLYPSTEPNPPRHITVLHNNQIFSMDVYGNDNRPLNVEQLYEQLTQIVEKSPNPGPPVGVLTMTDRTSWAKTYKKLIKDKTNKAAMEDVQRSIFVLCLDEKGQQAADDAETRSLTTGQMLHGGGSKWNSGNRWFDKTLQFIVAENGACGLNYEHTTAEGPPIAALMDHVLTFCEKNEESGLKAGGTTEPRKFKLNFSEELLKDVEEAKVQADNFLRDVDLTVFTYQGYGKDFSKSQRLSPDGYIQVAMQLTYFRLYGVPCATYETASLRRFQLGRTDTIRSCSIDSFNFTKAMDDSSSSREVKADLFRKAVLAHRKYTDEAVNGNGIDRHLLGWKLSAIEAGMNVPDLHMDGTYSRALYFKLSTSQVGAKHNAVMAFGPVVPDGYGVCYNPQNSKINFSVSAFYNSPETDSKRFATTLSDSLNDIQVMLGAPPTKL